MNSDGSGPMQITNECYRDTLGAPSPDGTKVVFVSSCPDGNEEIYTMNIDGTNRKRLTTNSSIDTTPVWSPDGTRIAFVSDRNFDGLHIFLMNLDGSNQQRLTTNVGGNDTHPAWSPDGTKLTYSRLASGPGSNPEIYVMRADGTGLVNLTNNPDPDDWPAWSPDGTKIAFASLRSNSRNIYLMNADGSNQTKLTSLAGDSSPTWAPDGSKIAFSSIIDGNDNVYVMNPDGTNVTRITTNALHDSFPRWQTVFAPSFRPTLITQSNSTRAIALDSVTMLREPLSLVGLHNFSSDQTTRVALFAVYARLNSGEDKSAIAVFAEDLQGTSVPLTVEFVTQLPTMNWVTQMNVKLPPGLTGDVKLWFTLRGVSSDKALVLLQ